MSHNERCKECKVRVREFLEKIYGTVLTNHRIPLTTLPENLTGHPHSAALSGIYDSLRDYRGFSEFVRASYVDVDFFIPDPGLIVEFDESQHFTAPRKITLSKYPPDLATGFSREAWMDHCDDIRAFDNDPPFRDEQRAWYDTLRDFLPEMTVYRPTVRLYARDQVWCEMDPEKPGDVLQFKGLLEAGNVTQAADKAGIQSRHLPENDWIATVILSSNLHIPQEKDPAMNTVRLSEMEQILATVLEKTTGDGVILFPGGWVHTQFSRAETIYPEIERRIKAVLSHTGRDIKVSIGIDGFFDRPVAEDPYDQDQIALTADRAGIISLARKFHPSDDTERKQIILAKDYLEGEGGKSRIFTLNGVRYFPFVCYDAYGPYHEPAFSSNPGADIGLNLIHRFRPKGEPLNQENYFPLNAWSGTSFSWNIPVFGTSIFFRRAIPPGWPSGIMWNGGDTWRKAGYDDITLPHDNKILVPLSEGSVEVRFFTNIAEKIIAMKRAPAPGPVQNNRSNPRNAGSVMKSGPLPATAVAALYEELRNRLGPLFGGSYIDQKTKYTYRGMNRLGYPGRTELDMISLFKPLNAKVGGVRARIYPFVLAAHSGETDLNRILAAIPDHFTPKGERENPHPAEMYYEGTFRSVAEVERFVGCLKK